MIIPLLPSPFYRPAHLGLMALAGMVLIGCHTTGTGAASRQTVEAVFAEALAHSRVIHDDPAEQALRDAGRAAAPAGERPLEPPPPLALLPDADGPRVGDVFIETDLRQALSVLASQANMSLTLDERVQGVANGVIDDEPFEAALQKLLLPLGYVYHKYDDRAYLIGVPDPHSSLFPLMAERHEFRPRYLAPKELADIAPTRFHPFLRINDKHNLIIVEAPPAIARRIVWEFEQNDQPLPQVVLEAIVCVLEPDSQLRFGLDFEQGLDLSSGDFVNFAMNNLDLRGLVGREQFDAIRSFRFTSIFLRALAHEGYLAIRAAPRVMARSGEQAEIHIGRETFFGIQPEIDQRLIRQEIRQIESGIMLDIRPVVRGSNVVVHIERAEVSEDLRVDNVNGADRFPIINRRLVSTTVDLEDGQTIVIGGLVQRRHVDQQGRIPLLGDVPGIGTLFQRIDRREEQAEVAIFISARIVERTAR